MNSSSPQISLPPSWGKDSLPAGRQGWGANENNPPTFLLPHPPKDGFVRTLANKGGGIKLKIILLAICVFGMQPLALAKSPDPTKLLEQMDQVLSGNSHDMLVTLDVKTKRWQRAYKIRVQMKGVDY